MIIFCISLEFILSLYLGLSIGCMCDYFNRAFRLLSMIFLLFGLKKKSPLNSKNFVLLSIRLIYIYIYFLNTNDSLKLNYKGRGFTHIYILPRYHGGSYIIRLLVCKLMSFSIGLDLVNRSIQYFWLKE